VRNDEVEDLLAGPTAAPSVGTAAEADFKANELSGRSAPRTGHSRSDLKNVETAKSKRDAARERPPALNRIDEA